MNHSLSNAPLLHELRDELREVADSWRHVVFGTAMGMLHLVANTSALQKSWAGRTFFRRSERRERGNWRR